MDIVVFENSILLFDCSSLIRDYRPIIISKSIPLHINANKSVNNSVVFAEFKGWANDKRSLFYYLRNTFIN